MEPKARQEPRARPEHRAPPDRKDRLARRDLPEPAGAPTKLTETVM